MWARKLRNQLTFLQVLRAICLFVPYLYAFLLCFLKNPDARGSAVKGMVTAGND